MAALFADAALLGWHCCRCDRYGLLRLPAFATVTLIAALLRWLRRKRCHWHGSRLRCYRLTALVAITALFRRRALFELRWRRSLWCSLWCNLAWRSLEWCALLATTTLLNVSANRRLHSRCRRRDWHRYWWHGLAALIAIATLVNSSTLFLLLRWRYRRRGFACRWRGCIRYIRLCGHCAVAAFSSAPCISRVASRCDPWRGGSRRRNLWLAH